MTKNIIFDVGEVLLGYRWKEMLIEYGIDEQVANEIGNIVFTDPLWSLFDMGLNSMEETIHQYQKKYGKYKEIIEWFIQNNADMRVDRPDVWEKVRRLKESGYCIYLLSNYSKELFENHTKGASFMDVIDGKVVSYEVHLQKPDAKIYKYLLDKYHLDAKECIFFDDRIENVKAAIDLGIKGIQILSKEDLLREMNCFLEMSDNLKN